MDDVDWELRVHVAGYESGVLGDVALADAPNLTVDDMAIESDNPTDETAAQAIAAIGLDQLLDWEASYHLV